MSTGPSRGTPWNLQSHGGSFGPPEHSFGRFNFHREAVLADLTGLVIENGDSNAVVLAAEPGYGRGFLVEAVAWRASREGFPTGSLTLDLGGWEPDEPNGRQALGRYLDFQLERQGLGKEAREGRREKLLSALGIVGAEISLASLGLAAVVLTIDQPLQRLAKLLPRGRSTPPEPLPAEALRRLLAEVRGSGRLLVHLRNAEQTDELFRKLLVDQADYDSDISVVLAASPTTETSALVTAGSFRGAIHRYDLEPLSAAETQACLDRGFPDHNFPAGFAEALVEAGLGRPAEMARVTFTLLREGALSDSATGNWGLPAEGFASPEVQAALGDTLDQRVARALDGEPEPVRRLLRKFLDHAAVCGELVPGDLLFEKLGLTEDEVDDLEDRLDRLFGPDGVVPMFDDLEFRHPGFPHHAIRRFRNAAWPAALLRRIRKPERQVLAEELLHFFTAPEPRDLGRLPPTTRAAASLLLGLVDQVDDPARRQPFEDRLRFWVRREEIAQMGSLIKADLRAGRLHPEVVWRTLIQTSPAEEPQWLLELVEAYEQVPGGVPVERRGQLLVDRALGLFYAGNYPKALEAAQQSLKVVGPGTKDLARAEMALGRVLGYLGEPTRGRPHLEKALALAEELYGSSHPVVATFLVGLSQSLMLTGNYSSAEALLCRAREIDQQHNWSLADAPARLGDLGFLFISTGRFSEAEAVLKQALRLLPPMSKNGVLSALLQSNLATIASQGKRFAEAEELLEGCVAKLEVLLGPGHPDVGGMLLKLSTVLLRSGRAEEAEVKASRSLKILVKKLGPRHWRVQSNIDLIRDCFTQLGRSESELSAVLEKLAHDHAGNEA